MSVGFVVNPLMSGLRYISSIPALSAPSAKILILSSATERTTVGGEDRAQSRTEIPRAAVGGRIRDRPFASGGHEQCLATGAATALHVGETIADHPRATEVDAVPACREPQKVRAWLATPTLARESRPAGGMMEAVVGGTQSHAAAA